MCGISPKTHRSLPFKVPDLVNSKTTVRAAMYQESFDFKAAAKEHHPRKYLVIYQTDFEECLKSKEYINNVRTSSEIWPDKKGNADVGDFNARNYKLIQDYDPDGRGEGQFLSSHTRSVG
jgi:hypothetical protein